MQSIDHPLRVTAASDSSNDSTHSSELKRKLQAEADSFSKEVTGFHHAFWERTCQDLRKRVIPTPQDLPKDLRKRTMVSISDAILAGTSSSEGMAILQKLQKLLEKTPSIYFGNSGFYMEMPSLTKKQKLIEEQRKNHEFHSTAFEKMLESAENEFVKFQTTTQKSLQEQQTTIAALQSQLISLPLIAPPLDPASVASQSAATNNSRINAQDENGNTDLHRR